MRFYYVWTTEYDECDIVLVLCDNTQRVAFMRWRDVSLVGVNPILHRQNLTHHHVMHLTLKEWNEQWNGDGGAAAIKNLSFHHYTKAGCVIEVRKIIGVINGVVRPEIDAAAAPSDKTHLFLCCSLAIVLLSLASRIIC